MNTPEGNKRGGITVRRKLANGLSIVALGVSSAMGVGGCSGIKEGKTYPQETQTQSAQGELTEQNTIMIPSRPTEGDYDAGQWERIQSGEFSDQENAYENWTRYWGAAENGPFHPETKDLHYKYLFDEGGNCFVLLEASGEGREGKLFALPIKDGLFMEAPPEIPNEGFDIPEGFGPLMLTGSVAYRDGGLVRLDENGGVSERLNLETARWESAGFVELLPSTWEACLEENSYGSYSEFEERHPELVGRTDAGGIDPADFETFTTGIPNADIEAEKKPSYIYLNIKKADNGENPFRSCEVFEKDGHQIVTLGIVTKRPGSDVTEVLYYAMDLTYVNQSRAEKGLEPYDFTQDYERIKSGNFKEIYIALILWRGYAEEGGPWDPLLSFDPKKMEIGSDYTMTINYGIHGSSDPQLAQDSWEEIQKIIIPTVSIGVI